LRRFARPCAGVVNSSCGLTTPALAVAIVAVPRSPAAQAPRRPAGAQGGQAPRGVDPRSAGGTV